MPAKKQSAERPVFARESPSRFLDLSSFELESVTLEIRYPFAYSLWDEAGQLWKAIQDNWPDIVPIFVDPKKTDFRRGDTRLTVEMEQARIIELRPEKSLKQFLDDSREFIRMTTRCLQISTYKRVGLRLIYFKEFNDSREAAAAFLPLDLIRVPEGKKFEIDELPKNLQYALRWESDKKGIMLQCRSETRTMNLDVPFEAAHLLKPVHSERHGITLDVDYYTVAPVEPGQMDTSEWVKHAMHLIARDSRYLFGE